MTVLCPQCVLLLCLFALAIGQNESTITQYQSVRSADSENEECNLPQSVTDEIAGYAGVTQDIIDFVTKGPYKGKLWKSLGDFVDKFGPGYCGTPALENAIDYLINVFEENDLEDVRTEDVEVPFWDRGQESAVLLEPRKKPLSMLGLGLSVATPPEGITADAIVVRNFDELNALSKSEVLGKIVVYNQPFISYRESGAYRMLGASEAAKKGAVAALVRSVTPFSLATPHSGILMYEANVTQIPAASITLENAEQLWRIQERGEKLTIKLIMPATLDYKMSRNIYADLKGSSLERDVVIVGGHVDTWDIGEGAMDNGGGSFISWIAPVILKQLNLRPRRTLRTIMWTGEELGIFGLGNYVNDHENDGEFINFAMDSDLGTFTPLGLIYDGSKTGECMMREILKLFKSINATEILVQSGRRNNIMAAEGIPYGGLLNANEKYFWYHHSAADSMNVLDSDDLDLCAAFWAAFSYVVADLSQNIPRI